MLTKKALLVVFCSLVFPICPLLYGQATASFSGTAAVTATLAYGLLEIFGSVLLAALWGQVVSQRSTRFESEKSFVGAA